MCKDIFGFYDTVNKETSKEELDDQGRGDYATVEAELKIAYP